MYAVRICRKTFLAVCLCLALAPALAQQPEDEALAKARKDYEDAMKTNDVGLQNAMKIELSVQLAKAKERRTMRATEKSKTETR